MVNTAPFDTPPPGSGLNTVTVAVPEDAMSLDGIAAVSRVELAKVVGRGEPFQRTDELLMKLVPLTVSVKVGPPAAAELGLRLSTDGKGFAEGAPGGENSSALSLAPLTTRTCPFLNNVAVCP